jgi:hypothetical protein
MIVVADTAPIDDLVLIDEIDLLPDVAEFSGERQIVLYRRRSNSDERQIESPRPLFPS